MKLNEHTLNVISGLSDIRWIIKKLLETKNLHYEITTYNEEKDGKYSYVVHRKLVHEPMGEIIFEDKEIY